jgi:hypothetical protein
MHIIPEFCYEHVIVLDNCRLWIRDNPITPLFPRRLTTHVLYKVNIICSFVLEQWT